MLEDKVELEVDKLETEDEDVLDDRWPGLGSPSPEISKRILTK